MDLKKICLYEENYTRIISDEDIAKMENKKIHGIFKVQKHKNKFNGTSTKIARKNK